MKILFCVEFYFPSLGGAQEVVRQLAERMAARGHDVSVATSRVASRSFRMHKGVQIEEFSVSGNLVRGIEGEVDRYRRFLIEGNFDLVFFYAAQQWTFDAAWLIVDKIEAKTVLVPCGYSGLMNPAYASYFTELPEVLRKFDCLIYHALNYRDVAFGIANGLTQSKLLCNGADDLEFSVSADEKFRQRHDIPADAVALLTVGTMTGLKGHAEVLSAFERASFGGRPAVLILNGNEPEWNVELATPFRAFCGLCRLYGLRYTLKHVTKKILCRCGISVGKVGSVREQASSINKCVGGRKRVIVCNLPRAELVQAYMNADLFVFASNIEYSPLVLFESCAAGLPFLSVPSGNAAEIVTWTGGGEICPASVDEYGFTRVSVGELARRIDELVVDEKRLQLLGQQGQLAWKTRYNWNLLSKEYEGLFTELLSRGLQSRDLAPRRAEGMGAVRE